MGDCIKNNPGEEAVLSSGTDAVHALAPELAGDRPLCGCDHPRHRGPGRLQPRAHDRPRGETLGIGIFLTYLVPPTLLFLPLSRIIAERGLQNSMWSLVLVYPTFTIPFCTWLLIGFFQAIPVEIEEAAIVDGCSLLGAFIKMTIPLSVPAILTVVIFTFTLTLQEFVYALTFVSASDQKPITLGVTTDLVRGDIFFWGEIMAGALIAAIPVAIAYNLFLDRFIAGITGGAVK